MLWDPCPLTGIATLGLMEYLDLDDEEIKVLF